MLKCFWWKIIFSHKCLLYRVWVFSTVSWFLLRRLEVSAIFISVSNHRRSFCWSFITMTLHSRIFRSSKYRVKRKLTSNDKQVNKGSFIEKTRTTRHWICRFYLLNCKIILLSLEALVLNSFLLIFLYFLCQRCLLSVNCWKWNFCMYNQYIAIFIMFIDSDSRTVLITVSAYFNVEW